MNLAGQQLGQELRDDSGEFLSHRRAAAALTLTGMASLAVIALYQLGVFKHLPEPAISVLDATKVNGSAAAYGILHTPDAVLGLGSYAVTHRTNRNGRREPDTNATVDTFGACRKVRSRFISGCRIDAKIVD